MRSYMVKLPRGIEVDIFNLPENFEEQIKESFKGYTEETAKEYRYCDKLEDDIYCFEFMEECYDRGKKDASLYAHFGSADHHIYDQIQKVLVKVITIVMNYED